MATEKSGAESESTIGAPGERVALVTGGATGLGAVISRQLAERGFRLAVTYAHAEGDATVGAENLRAAGATVQLFRADIGVNDDIEALIENVYAAYGRLDVVVNNAGTTRHIPFPNIKAVDEATWDAIMDVNLKGTFLVSRAAALRMVEQGGGAIVNISSSAGVLPSGSSIPYAVSKAGIIHVTKALAIALAPKVRVNCVAPSLMVTRWWNGNEPATENWIKASRFGKPLDLEDVAAAIVFLATTESVSGQTLLVDQANYFM